MDNDQYGWTDRSKRMKTLAPDFLEFVGVAPINATFIEKAVTIPEPMSGVDPSVFKNILNRMRDSGISKHRPASHSQKYVFSIR